MKNPTAILCVFILCSSSFRLTGCDGSGSLPARGAPRLDVFHQVLEILGDKGQEKLTAAQLQTYIDGVMNNVETGGEEAHSEEEDGSHEEESEERGECVEGLEFVVSQLSTMNYQL